MKRIEDIISKYSESNDIQVEEIPSLDLYMDQILTFFSNHLEQDAENKNSDLITKSMINNYTKEKILSPVKGKKYSKNQIVQLLCIINLKQTLSLAEIKTILNSENMDEEKMEEAYSSSLLTKEKLVSLFSKDLIDIFSTKEEVDQKISEKDIFEIVLTLSSLSNFLKSIASELVAELENDLQDH